MKQEIEKIEALVQQLFEKISSVEQSINSTPIKQKWMNSDDVCKSLGISIRTVENYKKKGILPYSKIEGLCYYKCDDILKLLEKNYIKF